MQDVAGPAFAQARDVGELIAQARCDEEPPRDDRAAVAQHDAEARSAVAHDARVALPAMIATP